MSEEVAAARSGAVRSKWTSPVRAERAASLQGGTQSACQLQEMIDSNSPIEDLRARWHALHDLDRAREIYAIHQAGMSLREIARHLNCCRSLLVRLLLAANAAAEDLALARQIPISTRALARRARAGGIRGIARHPEYLDSRTRVTAKMTGKVLMIPLGLHAGHQERKGPRAFFRSGW